jgi:anti-sigma factor RsiW
MDQHQSLSNDDRENLVAYLDGELNDDEAAVIERLLAENPEARAEAEMLTRTSALLDELPHTSASQEFTARTLSAIQVARVDEEAPRMWWQKWSAPARRGAAIAVAVCALVWAGLVGYWSTTKWVPDESEQLVRDLPVIENVYKYSEVENVAFLRALESSEMFDENEGLPEF